MHGRREQERRVGPAREGDQYRPEPLESFAQPAELGAVDAGALAGGTLDAGAASAGAAPLGRSLAAHARAIDIGATAHRARVRAGTIRGLGWPRLRKWRTGGAPGSLATQPGSATIAGLPSKA